MIGAHAGLHPDQAALALEPAIISDGGVGMRPRTLAERDEDLRARDRRTLKWVAVILTVVVVLRAFGVV